MKKLLIILTILMTISFNANAGIWTYTQATSAKHKAQEAAEAIKETQEDVQELKEEVKDLKDKINNIINLLEKQNEEKEKHKKD